MKKINTVLLGMILISFFNASGQDETDAFRYSQLVPTGTARFSSLAGSMGGFGADFSCLSSNPAGIGVYKRNEFTISPSLYYAKTTSTYNTSDAYDWKYNFNLGNLGAVFVMPVAKKWFVQFGTGLNRLNNYNNRYIIKGINQGYFDNTTTSMTDYFAQISNGVADSNLTGLSDWAYQNWIIDPDTNIPIANQYISHIAGLNVNQRKNMSSTGSANEYIFSGGANYNDVVYIGATLGIPFFSYTNSYTYTETLHDSLNTQTLFRSLSSRHTLSSKGTGINLKLGVLYQPFKFLRFGAAFHTPTFYNNIREYYSFEYETIWEGKTYDDYTFDGKFDYTLTTPYRVLGDIGFIFGKYGFINVHYNFTDYSTMQLFSRYYDFEGENEKIREYYQAVHNIGISGELNLSPVSLRLGYMYSSNPYQAAADNDGSYHLITGGIGLRTNHFFTDFAYVHRFFYDKSVFYDTPNSSIIDSKITNQHFILTFGIKI